MGGITFVIQFVTKYFTLVWDPLYIELGHFVDQDWKIETRISQVMSEAINPSRRVLIGIGLL